MGKKKKNRITYLDYNNPRVFSVHTINDRVKKKSFTVFSHCTINRGCSFYGIKDEVLNIQGEWVGIGEGSPMKFPDRKGAEDFLKNWYSHLLNRIKIPL